MVIFRVIRDFLCSRSRGGQLRPSRVHGRRSLVRENLWVILFIAMAGGLYCHGMSEKEATYMDLQTRMGCAQNELRFASAEREELLRQIQSQSDPEWIELILM